MRRMRCGAIAGILGLGGCIEPNPIYLDATDTGGATSGTTDAVTGVTVTTDITTDTDDGPDTYWPDPTGSSSGMTLPPGDCGDGELNPGEECDDGDENPANGCSDECKLPRCGDGDIQEDETCDDENLDNNDACLNTCTQAACGDGILHVMVEQCDDANDNDVDICNNQCMKQFCGDGVVNVDGEQCDDDNDVNTDECLNDCMLPICGDGVLKVGVEECDDANKVDDDKCKNDCTAPLAQYTIFVTSQGYTGNLGGLAGADAECQDLATVAKLPGTYFAWLGGPLAPVDRMFHAPTPYVRTDGAMVAKNWADLTDGTLVAPIDKDESGDWMPMLPGKCGIYPAVYTNAGPDGSLNDPNTSCSDWTSKMGFGGAGQLGPDGVDMGEWTKSCVINCDTLAPIYCVQQ